MVSNMIYSNYIILIINNNLKFWIKWFMRFLFSKSMIYEVLSDLFILLFDPFEIKHEPIWVNRKLNGLNIWLLFHIFQLCIILVLFRFTGRTYRLFRIYFNDEKGWQRDQKQNDEREFEFWFGRSSWLW